MFLDVEVSSDGLTWVYSALFGENGFFSVIISILKKIPVGFSFSSSGVSLYYFYIAIIITSIVVAGIVNVVRVSAYFPNTREGKARASQARENRAKKIGKGD